MDGVAVTYYFDGDDRTERDAVWTAFGATREDGRVQSSIPVLRTGVKRREETYRILCLVESRMPAEQSQQECDERCLVLFREVEETLAADPYLGRPDLLTGGTKLAEFRIAAGPTLGGRLCRVEASIEIIQARLL